MNIDLGISTIKEVGEENGFKIEGTKTEFQIFKNKVHAESFKIKKDNNGNNDLLVYQWEKESDGYGKHCIYALRSFNDVIKFSNVLIASTDIRGGRNRI